MLEDDMTEKDLNDIIEVNADKQKEENEISDVNAEKKMKKQRQMIDFFVMQKK